VSPDFCNPRTWTCEAEGKTCIFLFEVLWDVPFVVRARTVSSTMCLYTSVKFEFKKKTIKIILSSHRLRNILNIRKTYSRLSSNSLWLINLPTLPYHVSPHLMDTVPISTSHGNHKVLASMDVKAKAPYRLMTQAVLNTEWRGKIIRYRQMSLVFPVVKTLNMIFIGPWVLILGVKDCTDIHLIYSMSQTDNCSNVTGWDYQRSKSNSNSQ